MNAGRSESLSGLNVMLTRPAAQADGITRAIRAHGGNVIALPLLDIVPVTEVAAIERLKSCIMALDNYEIAIFISTNAASLGVEWIENYWPQLPMGIEACAVGPGTAQILRQLPWPVHCAQTGVTSEDMLALPVLQDVEGKRIALFRGQGGRELIAESLRARGARVDYLELYTRAVPAYSPEAVLQRLEDDNINVVVVTSLQILESLVALVEPAQLPAKRLRALQVVVPSLRVREQALRAGFIQVIDAGGADDRTVLQTLQHCRAALQPETEAR